MIKAGDRFNFNKKEWTVIGLYNFEDMLEAKDEDGNESCFMQSKVYKNWYEQQKQRADELESLLYTYRENSKSIPDLIEKIQASNKRADELEKRWSEMKERMEREQKEAFSKGYIDYDAFSYVLEVMHDLEEDNNA